MSWAGTSERDLHLRGQLPALLTPDWPPASWRFCLFASLARRDSVVLHRQTTNDTKFREIHFIGSIELCEWPNAKGNLRAIASFRLRN